MLKSIYIENIILIDKVYFEFNEKMNSITGDSGSGKSIILESINIILGNRANQDIVRDNSKNAVIIAEFNIENNKNLILELNQTGYECDGSLIIKKVITKNSGSKIFINDIPSSVNFIKNITANLIDIHDQFGQSKLLNPSEYISIIDRYSNLESEIDKLKKMWLEYKEYEKSLDEVSNLLSLKISELDELISIKQDLEKYNILPNEENDLIAKRVEALQGKKLGENLSKAVEHTSKLSVPNLSNSLERLLRDESLPVSETVNINKAIVLCEEIDNNIEKIKDVLDEVEVVSLEGKNHNIEKIEERIDEIRTIASKYRVPSSQLFTFIESIDKEIEAIEKLKIDQKELSVKKNIFKDHYQHQAKIISDKRIQNAVSMTSSVNESLMKVGMEGAEFNIKVLYNQEKLSESGSDEIEFLASTNKGMPKMPVHKIASGGEMSRFALAFKSAIASRFVNGGVLIFDEIESGLSGKTCQMVATQIKAMSQVSQIIAITHNQYIAGYADKHFKVLKHTEEDKVQTQVKVLNEEERVIEIANIINSSLNPESLSIAKSILNENILD